MSKELTPLKALEELKQNNKDGSHLFDDELLDNIANALSNQQERIYELEETNHLMYLREHKNEKKLKALEIIKKKRVDCLMIVLSQTYIEYNDMCEIEKDKLTQVEYGLLKEVLL